MSLYILRPTLFLLPLPASAIITGLWRLSHAEAVRGIKAFWDRKCLMDSSVTALFRTGPKGAIRFGRYNSLRWCFRRRSGRYGWFHFFLLANPAVLPFAAPDRCPQNMLQVLSPGAATPNRSAAPGHPPHIALKSIHVGPVNFIIDFFCYASSLLLNRDRVIPPPERTRRAMCKLMIYSVLRKTLYPKSTRGFRITSSN